MTDETQRIVDRESLEFQGAILASVAQHTSPYVVKLRGIDYVMFPETFNPNYAKASLFLLDNLGVREGDVVLDPFTGCGADAIFALREGASRAVAIDKFRMPRLCTEYNAHALGLSDRLDVREGDLFEPLHPDEKFDLVIANPPFRNMSKESDMEAAIRDPGYQTLKKFFAEVGNHLNPNGRIRAVFADVGDLAYFEHLGRENGFSVDIVNEMTYASAVRIRVYEMKHGEQS